MHRPGGLPVTVSGRRPTSMRFCGTRRVTHLPERRVFNEKAPRKHAACRVPSVVLCWAGRASKPPEGFGGARASAP